MSNFCGRFGHVSVCMIMVQFYFTFWNVTNFTKIVLFYFVLKDHNLPISIAY